MQFVKTRLGILTLCLIITSACSPKAVQITNAISNAQIEFDAVRASKAKELYPDDFREAEEKLNQAKKLSESWFRGKKAYSDALESTEASKKLMKKILVEHVRPDVEKIKEDVEKKGRDTSLNDLIPKLTGILKYIDAVVTNKEDVNVSKFVEMKDKLDDAQRRKECTVDGILENDVSFNRGQYKIEYLSEQGIQLLEKIVRESIAIRKGCLERIPDSKVVITINTYGYTDAQPFQEGTKLIKELEENDKCPQESKERRECLNQRLSEFRATAIGDYLKQRITESDPKNIRVEKGKFIGRGEEIPKGVENPLENDPRRRICIIESVMNIK